MRSATRRPTTRFPLAALPDAPRVAAVAGAGADLAQGLPPRQLGIRDRWPPADLWVPQARVTTLTCSFLPRFGISRDLLPGPGRYEARTSTAVKAVDVKADSRLCGSRPARSTTAAA